MSGATTAAPVAAAGTASLDEEQRTAAFWRWAIALGLFWFIVVALHEWGGTEHDFGAGFALLVLIVVLLTQGQQAMANVVALFKEPT